MGSFDGNDQQRLRFGTEYNDRIILQCSTCHCCCGKRQLPPQISNDQARSDEHIQLSHSEVYPEGYRQGVDHYGQHISQRPYSPTGGNCQHLVYTKPARTNQELGDCIGSGIYDGQSGPTTLTAPSRRPEFASDGVRLLHYSGS
ncbi:hypothetical protein Tcan_04924 [Toxocara canis]|uniref:Uncharacterized protein n=1 Tax=Toxocara canis TaxID=6265 RepID=A0A0B2VT70_TOXCA|nr:hypothetical protein Tcan_04924 [Toxocara canis]